MPYIFKNQIINGFFSAIKLSNLINEKKKPIERSISMKPWLQVKDHIMYFEVKSLSRIS